MDDEVKTPKTPLSCLKTASMLQDIATATSGCISGKYFTALVTSLSTSLGMETVLIGEVTNNPTPSIQTKAVILNERLVDNFSYELADTPCENTLDKKHSCYPKNVQHAFPRDSWLKDMDIEGYIGAALIASSGIPMGILVACSQSPIQNTACVKACFDMVVARTAAEMERMQAEERLLELLQVVEQSPVVIAKANIHGNLDYVNKNFETVTGYSKEEVIGKDPKFLSAGVTSDKIYKGIWDNITQGKIWSGEILNTRKNGSHFWAKATFGPLRNSNDEITGYISLKEEITQRKESEKHLRLAASVFETSKEALIVTDVDMNIMKVNQAFSLITGYEEKEVINKTPAILQSGRHDKKFYAAMFRALKNNDIWEGEVWDRRKNGEIYPEWLKISIIRDDVGNHEGYVGLFSDISKLKQNESLIQHQANFDTLTGLANRNLFQDRFSGALEMAEKNNTHVAVLFIDIDRFQYVNDTLGHSAGDKLIQSVANRLTNGLQRPRTVARFGGDEFVVVLPNESTLHNIEDTVVKALNDLERPHHINGDQIFSSVSIGVSVYPFDGNDTETLLRKADSAMHKAKGKGRNNFQFFTMEMDIEAQRRQELEHKLHNAVEKKQLFLTYQPIIDPITAKIVSAEALIRWQHPKDGLIAPDQFIPLAEEVGLIVPIGEWVLREACREAMRWGSVSGVLPGVSVNLSSVQFQKQDIPSLVKAILIETQLPPERLTLEITESLLVADDNDTLRQLQEIRALGVSLSIDDFGTGYSSLSYLKKFPVSILKIDRSFIMGLPHNPEDEALVSAILGMASSLNLAVVAEGVETQDQVKFLTQKGCQYLQGYYFSKPLCKDDFAAYLTDS